MYTPRDRDLEISLLLIRIATGAFLLVWACDKIVNADRALQTFTHFYLNVSGSTIIVVVGALQLLLVLTFLAGALRTLSYGAVLIMHFVSTAASYPMYLAPLARPNILFWAAFPVLAGLIALFVLRKRDRLLSIDG